MKEFYANENISIKQEDIANVSQQLNGKIGEISSSMNEDNIYALVRMEKFPCPYGDNCHHHNKTYHSWTLCWSYRDDSTCYPNDVRMLRARVCHSIKFHKARRELHMFRDLAAFTIATKSSESIRKSGLSPCSKHLIHEILIYIEH